MAPPAVFIVTDIETDGSDPGADSKPSFASVARERIPASLHLQPLYDPKMTRVRG